MSGGVFSDIFEAFFGREKRNAYVHREPEYGPDPSDPRRSYITPPAVGDVPPGQNMNRSTGAARTGPRRRVQGRS